MVLGSHSIWQLVAINRIARLRRFSYHRNVAAFLTVYRTFDLNV